MTDDKLVACAREVLKIEAESILNLIDKVGVSFARAVNMIYASPGRVIITGIGKSGLVGKKIVATLTSTGTQAIFLHPVEGIHGDMGIVTKDDVILAISNSGETTELNLLISAVHRTGAPIIALTGCLASSLARNADVTIDVGVEKEACPFGLAPTSSTTAVLAMGDALAVALIEKREFKESDFYRFHPGGNLGLRLRAKVADVMIVGEHIPRVVAGATALAAIAEIDAKNKGFVLVTDAQNHLLGILTDGDIRRMISKKVDFNVSRVEELMTPSPKTIGGGASLAATIEFMQREEITTLAVVAEQDELRGYIHLHDILGRGGSLKISLP